MESPEKNSLAISIIARNEEKTLAGVIEAAIELARTAISRGIFSRGRVQVVDSGSTDSTGAIARGYAVERVTLSNDLRLSPAAARFAGLQFVDEEWVLFVDGDFLLNPVWILKVVDWLDQPEVAGITGWLEEAQSFSIPDFVVPDTRAAEPRAIDLAPLALFRTRVLRQVGGIEPFLTGAEDRDLGYRLRGQGFRIMELPYPLGWHYWAPDSESIDLITYLRSVWRWSVGDGQLWRLRKDRWIRESQLSRYLTLGNLRNLVVPAGLSGGFSGIVLGLASGIYSIILPSAIAFYLSYRLWFAGTRSRHAIPQLMYSVVRLVGFLAGMSRRAPPSERFPIRSPAVSVEGSSFVFDLETQL